ncbi:MmgE/PrpD family protein [Nitratireductor soli]|uniref:MmgE/PrpD family protein n=1 Tax=Nitratireductor soli TaxID=1670619 RepID=UPI00065E693E|nr:MmgE/PrpD family protein [Nitratireductor soli]
MPAPISRTLAAFAAQLKFDDIPGLAVEAINTGITDTVGVMMSGIGTPVSKLTLDSVGTRGKTGEARIFLGDERASAVDATLVNSVTTTSVVYDDVAFTGTHTSTILMPALFAEAEAFGASGRDVVRAYAAGYEAWARLAERDPDSYAGKGWHATAAFGATAASIAVCNLHGHDAETTLRAIGIAAAMPGGITASFDTDVGPFQVGRGAAAGVMAARLAKAGMTAPEDGLERPGRGMLVALSPKGAVDLDTPIADLGSAWRLETIGINIKQYPFGNMNQRAIDGTLDLVREHDVSPEAVERVEVLISEAQYAVVSKSPSTINFVPSHSITLAVAGAIIARRGTFAELSETFHSRPDVQALMKVIAPAVDKTIPADTQPNLGYSGGIRIHLKDGTVLESPSVSYARGHWTRRMSEEELWTKFAACTHGRLDEAKARRLFDQLLHLQNVGSIADLNA